MTEYNLSMCFLGLVSIVGAILFIWAYVKEIDWKIKYMFLK